MGKSLKSRGDQGKVEFAGLNTSQGSGRLAIAMPSGQRPLPKQTQSKESGKLQGWSGRGLPGFAVI